ncbi:MAG: CvpA family protein [Desulfamplus sp.]|nr:CvpA family protein [Desulfamplus sp.]
MNGFDIFIVIVISFCLIRGYFRGFVKEISSIVGVVAGYYGAHTYYAMLGNYLAKWINVGSYANILAFFLIFCTVFSLVSLAAHLIRIFLKVAFLGWVDRLCGTLFGTLKGFLFVSVVFIMLTALIPNGTGLMGTSRLAPYVAHFSEMAAVFASRELKGQFKIKYERIKTFWEEQKSSIQEIKKKTG